MQIVGLHRNIYKLSAYTIRQESLQMAEKLRYKQLGDWETLKKNGVSDADVARITGISRASFYRRKKAIKTYGIQAVAKKSCRPKRLRTSKISDELKQLVLCLRKARPTYGKAKIHAIIRRDHSYFMTSESSIGRILANLIKQGKIKRYKASWHCKKRRKFNNHAQRWKYENKPVKLAENIGKMVQIDHMSVCKNGIQVKHFQAWEGITKSVHAEIYSNATSKTATKFLDELEKSYEFPIKSIQVDGGSEFMKDFEEACKNKGIPLFVLPPKSPRYNGGVERANRTFREDFYDKDDLLEDSIGGLRAELKKALQIYNNFRPHQALDYLTPNQYTQQILRQQKVSYLLN